MLGLVGTTLKAGRPKPTSGLVGGVLALLVLLLATVLGALTPFQGWLELAGTQWETAQSQLTLVAVVIAGVAGLYHWSTKVFGRVASEGAGRTAPLVLALGGLLLAVPQCLSGLLGDGDEAVTGIDGLNVVALVGAVVVVLGGLLALVRPGRAAPGRRARRPLGRPVPRVGHRLPARLRQLRRRRARGDLRRAAARGPRRRRGGLRLMSAATAVSEEAFDLVPDVAEPVHVRPRVLLMGTALAAGAIIVTFAALLGLYLATRHAVLTGPAVDGEAPVWFADGNPIPLTPANMAFGTMLLSCVSMLWAVDAVGRNDRRNAFFALAMTLLFGGAVINATSFLYTQSAIPLAGETTPAGMLFYVVTGAHLALLVGAMVFASLMTFRTLGGEYAGRDRDGITAASMIWYLTAAIHGVIWYAVYVTK